MDWVMRTFQFDLNMMILRKGGKFMVRYIFILNTDCGKDLM